MDIKLSVGGTILPKRYINFKRVPQISVGDAVGRKAPYFIFSGPT